MAKYNFDKKVPKGYMYPLSVKESKNFVQNNDNISSISYLGISPHDQIKSKSDTEFWLGYVYRKKELNGLNFSVAIYASKKEFMAPVITKIKELLISETNKWVSWQLALPDLLSEGSNTLHISVVVDNGIVKSTSIEQKKTK